MDGSGRAGEAQACGCSTSRALAGRHHRRASVAPSGQTFRTVVHEVVVEPSIQGSEVVFLPPGGEYSDFGAAPALDAPVIDDAAGEGVNVFPGYGFEGYYRGWLYGWDAQGRWGRGGNFHPRTYWNAVRRGVAAGGLQNLAGGHPFYRVAGAQRRWAPGRRAGFAGRR